MRFVCLFFFLLQTFHTPSFGDEEFDILPLSNHISEPHPSHPSQMEHYQMQQPGVVNVHNMMDDTQYMWQQDAQQMYNMSSGPTYEQPIPQSSPVNQVSYNYSNAIDPMQNHHLNQQHHHQNIVSNS